MVANREYAKTGQFQRFFISLQQDFPPFMQEVESPMQHFILCVSFVFTFDACSVFRVEGGAAFWGWSCAWSVKTIPASVSTATSVAARILFGVTVSLS